MQQEVQLPFDLDLPPEKILKAGSLKCMYESGNLRYICLGKTELVRKVYGALRTEDWTTLPYRIQDESVTVNEADFTITYTAAYGREANLYQADFLIEGKADNSIRFSMKGTALSDFKRNRIGLCVHHPLKECAGRNALVTRPDGTMYQSYYPVSVSPSLPFLEMSQLEWITEDAITVNLTFEGDVFETEDQRNWSDGSYKTYSTRSDLPKPVQVRRGDTIRQSIIVKVTGSVNDRPAEANHQISEIKIPFPQIGYSRSLNSQLIHADTISWIKKIPFDHYRVSIVMNQNEWIAALQAALNEALQLNTKLELVVFFSEDFKNESSQLIQQLTERQLLVQSILALGQQHDVSSPALLQYLYPVFKSALPAVKIGYGTDLMFVDVNQHRPERLPFDFISFGLHPQAHAFDNRSILENLRSHPDIMKTAMQISMAQPVCIAPVTFKDRNSEPDQRQHSSLAAIWTLICLQNFSEAYSITLYELFGAGGILWREGITVKPSPVYEALAMIQAFQPVWVIKRYTGTELLMDGLLLENEHGDRLMFRAPQEYVDIRC